jgi:hypothetical protein
MVGLRLCSRCRRELEKRPCAQCDERPRMPNRIVCNKCHAAAWALAAYWRDMGMPLSWAAKPKNWLLGSEIFWREKSA